MVKKKNLLLTFSLILFTTINSGCVTVKGGEKDTSAYDGGVFVSVDKGSNWKQKVLIPSISGKAQNFAGVNVVSLIMDPSDNETLYFGSSGAGLLYTYDSTNTWRKTSDFGDSIIRAVAVDPNSKCTVYVSIGNKVFKSVDCNRSWNQIYFDNDPAVVIEAIAVDQDESSNVYIAISRGDIVKSTNGGEGWQTINRVNNRIKKILIDPNNSNLVYVVTYQKGVFLSIDKGVNWDSMVDLNNVLALNKLGMDIRDFIFVKSEPDTLFLATYYGLLKSVNRGATWEKVELIMPEKKATINALAVNPKDSKEIYYVTNTIFYRSSDGGENWTPIKLPTTRAGWRLLIDPESPNIIYMGLRKLEEN